MDAETCSNCEEPVAHAPVYFDGRLYCCTGCVAGGPCLCTYTTPSAAPVPSHDEAPERTSERTAPQPVAAASAPLMPRATAVAGPPAPPSQPTPAAIPRPSAPPPIVHPAATAPAPARDESREPIPFRRPGGLTVVVHVASFADQRDLLTFAGAMEASPEFEEVSLTRVTPHEAWLTVRAETPSEVADALERMPGFDIETATDQNLVEARLVVPPAAEEPEVAPPIAPVTPATAEADTLLPQRPRFRAFRPSDIPSPTMPLEGRPGAPAPVAAPPASEASTSAAPAPRPFAPAAAAPVAPGAPGAPAVPAAPRANPRPEAPAPAQASRQPSPVPAARPAPPAAREGERAEEFVNPEDRPGGAVLTVEHMTLVVYPFHSFAALNEFQGAVRRLHGVKNTRVRRFYRGTLHLAVDYEDVIPLTDRLLDLKDIDFQVASESRSELEIVLQDTTSLAAAGDS